MRFGHQLPEAPPPPDEPPPPEKLSEEEESDELDELQALDELPDDRREWCACAGSGGGSRLT